MKVSSCPLQGLQIIEPAVFGDSRGCFFELWSQKKFSEKGIPAEFEHAPRIDARVGRVQATMDIRGRPSPGRRPASSVRSRTLRAREPPPKESTPPCRPASAATLAVPRNNR